MCASPKLSNPANNMETIYGRMFVRIGMALLGRTRGNTCSTTENTGHLKRTVSRR
jgi:hypothetical protein